MQTIKVWKPLTKEPEISGARTLLFPVAFFDIQGSLVSVITLPAWVALEGGSPQLEWARQVWSLHWLDPVSSWPIAVAAKWSSVRLEGTPGPLL